MAQWALVTGATVGIGESFTRLLASKGYNIALVARDEVRLHERAGELREKYGIQTFVLPADLATKIGVKSVEKYIQSYEIEVLINNAGFAINKVFTASYLGDEQDLLNVLVRTPMRLMHVILPGMKERKSGTIINVSSVAGFIAGGTYSAAKSYLTVLSESINADLKGSGVKVSALCPGFTRTEFHKRARMKMKGLPSFLWLNADKLVTKAWKDAQANKPVSIPGWQYKLLIAIISITPRGLIRRVRLDEGKTKR
jgi:short-subunit dehydrogenase